MADLEHSTLLDNSIDFTTVRAAVNLLANLMDLLFPQFFLRIRNLDVSQDNLKLLSVVRRQ